MSTVIGIVCIAVVVFSLFSLIGGLINPSHFDSKKEDGTIKKASRSQVFVVPTILIFVFSVISIICFAPDEDEPEVVVKEASDAEVVKTDIKPVPSKPMVVVKNVDKAVSDSIAMYEGIAKRVAYAKKAISEARVEFDKENYERAKEILKNVPTIQGVGEVSILLDQDKHPMLKDAWNTQIRLDGLKGDIQYEEKSIEYVSKHWIRYPKGSVERMFEVIILDWYYSDVRLHNASFDYSILKGGSKKSIIKNIEFSNGKLSVSMRGDPDDYVDVNYRERTIEYIHPIKFMNEFRRLVITMWRARWEYNKKRYSKVSEIEFSIYFHGTRGTETLIAKFGLTRNAVQPVNFTKLRHKDGTFQDFIKRNGTYWLHREIPDMGTPAHLLSRRSN